MNPKATGELSEATILAALIKRGWAVSIPFGNNQRYDFIIDDGTRLLRTQCKTGRLRQGSVAFNTCSINGFTGKKRNYAGHIECFAVFCPETTAVYLVPASLMRKSGLRLRVNPVEARHASRSIWAKDYILTSETQLRADCGAQPTPSTEVWPSQPRKAQRPAIPWPCDAELSQLIWSKSAQRVARSLNVSGAALKKRCKRRGIETPPRGYWRHLQIAQLKRAQGVEPLVSSGYGPDVETILLAR